MKPACTSQARLCVCTISCDALHFSTAIHSGAHACQSNCCESLLFGSQDFVRRFLHLTLHALTQGAIKDYVYLTLGEDTCRMNGWMSE
jgi:hypothetical protein